MRLSRTQIFAVLALLLGLALAFLINIITGIIPPSWTQSHIGLSVALFALLILSAVIIAIKQVGSTNSISQIKEDQFNDFVKTVSEAESQAQSDPTFENTPYIAGKLLEWQDLDARLIAILNIQHPPEGYRAENWKRRADNEPLARLILRLTRAIMPALTRNRSKDSLKDLFRLAVPAYIIAARLEEWPDAARIAYALALSSYDTRETIRAKSWATQMEKSLIHLTSHDISDELHAQLIDIKGLIARDFDWEPKVAHKHFNDALVYANRAKNPLAIGRITVHMATLEKKERNFAKAAELYKQALNVVSPLSDPGPTLECYEALGEIALEAEKDIDAACTWYLQQLQLAEKTARPPHQVSAHRGLARSLLLKNTPHDTKQAYQHARQALRLEDSQSNKNELYIFLVHIADQLLSQH